MSARTVPWVPQWLLKGAEVVTMSAAVMSWSAVVIKYSARVIKYSAGEFNWSSAVVNRVSNGCHLGCLNE